MENAKIFYTDHERLRQEEKNIHRTVTTMQRAVDLWEASTGIKIATIENLKLIADDPEKYFCDHVLHEEKDREKNLKKMFGERANIAEVIEKIYLPANFTQVKNAMEAIRKIRLELFMVVESRIILSQTWHDRLIQKCYFVVSTPQQFARLEYAKRMLSFLTNEVETILDSEILESGKSKSYFDRLKLSKDYYNNSLPIGLKFSGLGNKREIEIDQHFVTHGFSTYLPEFIHRTPPQKTVNIEYRLAYFMDEFGLKTNSIFVEGQDVPTDKLRRYKTIVTPYIYHIINGRMVKTDKKGKVYSGGLIEQQI